MVTQEEKQRLETAAALLGVTVEEFVVTVAYGEALHATGMKEPILNRLDGFVKLLAQVCPPDAANPLLEDGRIEKGVFCPDKTINHANPNPA